MIAKKRLSLEISTIEEMVLMNMCDQLHKVKTCKCSSDTLDFDLRLLHWF